jgi:hypothetical protein
VSTSDSNNSPPKSSREYYQWLDDQEEAEFVTQSARERELKWAAFKAKHPRLARIGEALSSLLDWRKG